nr:MAG: hypothetical protein [Bacteriophage sp.]
MWIRSQRGKFLTDCDYFEVEKFHEQYGVITLSNRSDISVALGIYSSEKKALKVLDEIQTSIMTEHQFRIDELNCTRNYFGKEYKEIYQMPQDEDVEV